MSINSTLLSSNNTLTNSQSLADDLTQLGLGDWQRVRVAPITRNKLGSLVEYVYNVIDDTHAKNVQSAIANTIFNTKGGYTFTVKYDFTEQSYNSFANTIALLYKNGVQSIEHMADGSVRVFGDRRLKAVPNVLDRANTIASAIAAKVLNASGSLASVFTAYPGDTVYTVKKSALANSSAINTTLAKYEGSADDTTNVTFRVHGVNANDVNRVLNSKIFKTVARYYKGSKGTIEAWSVRSVRFTSAANLATHYGLTPAEVAYTEAA